MVRWKRLLYYLLINILVSACTVGTVLYFWDLRQSPASQENTLIPANLGLPEPTHTFTATENPLPTATVELIPYRVKAGDTLGHIAEQYGVSVQDLMDFNTLQDPDSLGSGQVLYIPAVSPGVPDETPSPAASVDPVVQSTAPVLNQEPAQIAIAHVIGAGDLPTERVRIEHRGGQELSLAGWRLVDNAGSTFVFPHLMLFTGGSVDIYTKYGVDGANALYWGRDRAVWESGSVVTLVDLSGESRSTFTIP
jgi:LysM repeat protein